MKSKKQFGERIKTLGLGVGVGAAVLAGGHLAWPSHSEARHNAPPEVRTLDRAPSDRVASMAEANPGALAALKSFNQALIALGEQVSPTVVSIYTTSMPSRPALPPGLDDELQHYFGLMPFQAPPMKREALGSGFVINAEDGLVVTNAHVVQQAGHNADEIMIKFIGEETGRGHAARVVGADATSDVALLKLVDKLPNLKAAVLGDSSQTHVAEMVLAVGNPYGHTHSVTNGLVSAIGRSLEGARSDFIQTSAGINPGNSGGPLINVNGEVIGINSAIDPRAPNIGFAIPINTAKEVIEQLLNGGRVHRAYMGVRIRDIDEELASLLHLKEGEGAIITDVESRSPAAKAGFERSDVIVKVNGQDVHSGRDVTRALDRVKPGATVEVEVQRGTKRSLMKVEVGDQAVSN